MKERLASIDVLHRVLNAETQEQSCCGSVSAKNLACV